MGGKDLFRRRRVARRLGSISIDLFRTRCVLSMFWLPDFLRLSQEALVMFEVDYQSILNDSSRLFTMSL